MFKPRPKHLKHLYVDMTAICDVAFLLLIFFILTAKPKQWLPVKVNLPASVEPVIWDGDASVAVILIAQGKVMFEIPDTEVRKQTLIRMATKYHIRFSPVEVSRFGKIDIIGVPIAGLKQYIDGYYNDETFFMQPGIRIDSLSNELANWVYVSRKVYKSTFEKNLDIAIDADKQTDYPLIEKIVGILGRQNIYKFELITTRKYESSKFRLKTLQMGRQ